MAKKNVKKKWKEGLKKRFKESNQRASGGSGFFKKGLDSDVNFWSCGEGDHIVDIIPYIAGDNDPNTKKGEPAYVLEIWAHYNVGTSGDDGNSVICLAKTYNRPCPICEHRKKLIDNGADEDTLKSLEAKRRCIYNICCYDSSKEEEKGVQVWHAAHWFTEYHFQTLAKKPTRGGRSVGDPFIYYMDPEEGRSLAFSKKGKGITTKFLGHRFVDRDYEIDNDTMEQAVCLDDIIDVLSYEEIYKLFWGEEEAEEQEETENEQQEEQEEEEDQKTRKRKVTTLRRKKPKVVKDPEPDPEPDPDEEEEEQETETEQDDNCDCNDFGKKPDDFEECEACDFWEKCIEAKSEADAKKTKTKTKTKSRRRRT